MSMQDQDQEAGRLAKAPRVSLEDIRNSIANVYYTNGESIATHASKTDYLDKSRPFPGSLQVLTVCMMVLKNGYMIVGTSAAASPENFDMAFGQRLAYEDCLRQIWPLMGFALRDVLHSTKGA